MCGEGGAAASQWPLAGEVPPDLPLVSLGQARSCLSPSREVAPGKREGFRVRQ